MYKNNIHTVYLYIVSIISLGMMVGGFIATVSAIANYTLPQYYLSWYDKGEYTQEEIDSMHETDRHNTDRRNIKSIITSVATFIIATPLFVYHWRATSKIRDA